MKRVKRSLFVSQMKAGKKASLQEISKKMSATKITVSATINADRNKIWDCYTQPEHITKWNFATDTWQCPSAENDLRPGGKYKARMEAKDGSFGFDFEAVYDEISIGNGFTCTMSDGRQATTRFEKSSGQTTVTITFDAEMENPVEMQQQGWQAILDNFKKYAEANFPTYYHGTKSDLNIGDHLEPGFNSNYGSQNKAAFIYLTATLDAATWGAELALGEGAGRIYIVEPTGPIEDDPNLTDKKFPGNPTRSYRSRHALRVIGEVTDWKGHPQEQLQAMKDHLERLKALGVEAIED